MFTRLRSLAAISMLALLLLAACTSTDDTKDNTTTITAPDSNVQPGSSALGKAQVDDVQVAVMESLPVQINLIVTGNLSDGCTSIDKIKSARVDQTYSVEIITTRPTDTECTQALVPYSETISLDVTGLTAGHYTVDVNGIVTSFDLGTDNIAPEGYPAPETNPAVPEGYPGNGY